VLAITKKLVYFVLLVFLLSGQAIAAQNGLPVELERIAPEAAGLLNGNAEEGYGLAQGASTLLNYALSDLKEYLFAGIRSIAMILMGIILLGVVESLADGGISARHTTLAGALYITAVSAGDINALIGMGRDTIENVSVLSKVLIPALAAATAATGGVTSASVRQVTTVFFVDVLLTVIDRLLIPLLYLYIASAAASAVLEQGTLEGIASLIKKGISWILAALLAGFTAYLSISGAIAGAADAQAVRIAKTAVSTAVPVVGGILAEAAESVLAGAGVLRATIGAFGTLAVIALCLLPFLRLGLQYLLYQGAVVIADASGPKKLAKMLSMLGDAFALILAMTGASALLLIISLVSTLTVVVR